MVVTVGLVGIARVVGGMVMEDAEWFFGVSGERDKAAVWPVLFDLTVSTTIKMNKARMIALLLPAPGASVFSFA